MRHLFLDCIKCKQFTPILIELRDLNSSENSLDQAITECLDRHGFEITGSYIIRAMAAGHFCFFLDGYDEVNHIIRPELMKQISKIDEKYEKCPIFISTRPEHSIQSFDSFDSFEMLPLNLESALSLVGLLPYDNDVKDILSKDMQNGLFEKHASFLSNPLLLSIMLLTYGENAEIPSKLSIYYGKAFDVLFQRHDAYKKGYLRSRLTSLDIQDFSRVFALFCVQTYSKRLFKMPRIQCLQYLSKTQQHLKLELNIEDYLLDLTSATCLMMEDGLDITFSHRSFQEYFVALYISTATQEHQIKLMFLFWENTESDNIFSLLLELNSDLVEKHFLIPSLRTIFNEVGIKKKVSVSNAIKLFKKQYNHVKINKKGMSALYYGQGRHISSVIKLTNDHYGEFKFLDRRGRSKINKQFQKKFASTYNVVIDVTKLNTKSPVMKDILHESKGIYSLAYLQSAYSAFTDLVKKHNTIGAELDKLIGL